MQKVNKKILISILTSIIVMITIVATTFAWVGIFTYANTDNFSLNLKVQELDANYFLTISATGKKGSFGDEADIYEIKRKILENQNKWQDSELDDLSKESIDELYSRNCVTTPSTCIMNGNKLSDFYSINLRKTGYYEKQVSNVSYLKFDIYLSVDTKEGIQEESEINSNVFLTDIVNTLTGTITTQRLTNYNPYKEMPSIPTEYKALQSLPDSESFKIDSANATRFALSIFEPIDINKDYVDSESPLKTIIYQGGTQNPYIYDDVFSLGGNLPEDYNTALRELLIVRPNYKTDLSGSSNYLSDLTNAINRGQNDLELIEENSKLWAKAQNIDNEPYLGVHNGVQTKQKITVYFWFEGWDADCVIGINEKPVTMNLTFTAGVID